MPIIGLLLAAGQSSRFGSNKCLAKMPDGVAMGLRSALNLAEYVDQVVCVIKPKDYALQALFQAQGFDTVICQTAEQGMSESLKAGVIATPQASGWLVALADMPLITASTYQYIVQGLQRGHSIVQPYYGQQRGHPVAFSAQYRDDLMQLGGDKGAKFLLIKYAHNVHKLSVDDQGVLQDFDTQADFDQHAF